MTYIRSRSKPPKQGPKIANQLSFRPLTPQVVKKELGAIIAGDATEDAYRRAASRMNRWLAQSPPDDADLVEMI
jgi:hypothetical protein